MLPNTINFTPKGDVTSYTFKAQDGKAVTFNLNQQLLYSLSHILMTATQKANWGLGLKLTDTNLQPPEVSTQVH